MKRKITIVIDTNIYGWYLAYLRGNRKPEAIHSYVLISKQLASKRLVVLATERIEREIKAAGSSSLKEIFLSTIEGIIKITEKVRELAMEYYKVAKEHKVKAELEDCEIVAAATIAGADYFVTENRATINNPEFKKIVEEINTKKRLKRLKILNSEEVSHEF
jgi:hypothetical protein